MLTIHKRRQADGWGRVLSESYNLFQRLLLPTLTRNVQTIWSNFLQFIKLFKEYESVQDYA